MADRPDVRYPKFKDHFSVLDFDESRTVPVISLFEMPEALPKEKIEVLVPQARVNDVTRPIDLIEEIARINGYNLIEAKPPPVTLSSHKPLSNIEKVKNHFLGAGFTESYLSSLIGEQVLNNKEFPFDISRSIQMINPLSKEHCILRQSLIPGLLDALKLNQSHQITPIMLFEVGKTYFTGKTKLPTEKETGVTEELILAGLAHGNKENWFDNKLKNEKNVELIYFKVKGILESFFIKNNCKVSFANHTENFLHPNFSLKMTLDNIPIGTFGCLHPLIEKRLELFGPIIVFEINLEPILKILQKTKSCEKISSQPAVLRDITVDLPKKYNAGIVTTEINKIISTFVISVNLISVYELDKENRSLTYRLKMQDFEQTLTSQQVEGEVSKIKNHLITCFQAKFRV